MKVLYSLCSQADEGHDLPDRIKNYTFLFSYSRYNAAFQRPTFLTKKRFMNFVKNDLLIQFNIQLKVLLFILHALSLIGANLFIEHF